MKEGVITQDQEHRPPHHKKQLDVLMSNQINQSSRAGVTVRTGTGCNPVDSQHL